jgi:hypothetical protein
MDIFLLLGFAFGGLVLLFLVLMGPKKPKDPREQSRSDTWLGDGDLDGD